MIAIILVSGVQGVTQTQEQVLYGLTQIAAVNRAVAVIESIVTGFMVAFIERTRPDIPGKNRDETSLVPLQLIRQQHFLHSAYPLRRGNPC